MNKITSTLAGIAVVAAAGIVPAFAAPMVLGTVSSPPGTFSFTNTGSGAASTISVTGAGATYNPSLLAPDPLATSLTTFMLNGTFVSANGGVNFYNATSFTGTDNLGTALSDSFSGAGDSLVFSTAPAFPSGFQVNSQAADQATQLAINLGPAPVPEASTVISFGALLALGGLAVLRRKSVKA